MERRRYLFNPGPVMVTERVRRAALHEDICHRVPEFEKIIRSIQTNMLRVFRADDDYYILPLTGSGTAANEAVIASYFNGGRKALLVTNGEFGLRLLEIFSAHDVPVAHLEYGWGERPDPAEVDARLERDPSIDAVAMVFHETSTSMINPVREVGEVAHRRAKAFFVDGVSAVGGEALDVVAGRIDFCTAAVNKCIASLPGVGIVCAKVRRLEEMEGLRPRTVYLDLYRQYRMLTTTGQTQNTPSTTMFYVLDEAVRELLEEGLENRVRRYRECARMIREGARKMGLETLIGDEHASSSLTTLLLPEAVPLERFIAEMESKGYTLYPGKGRLKELNVFQIANMGEIYPDTVARFLGVLEETYVGMRRSASGAGASA